MRRIALIMMALCAFVPAFAQDQSAEELLAEEPEVDEATAAKILEDIEAFNRSLEQVNLLGKVEPRQYGILRFLDRLNARVVNVPMKVGETFSQQHLDITLKACYVPADRNVTDAVAFINVVDRRQDEPSFDGWMVASSPALSAMDHPRYDVWIASCTNEAQATASEASALRIPPARIVEELNIVGE